MAENLAKSATPRAHLKRLLLNRIRNAARKGREAEAGINWTCPTFVDTDYLADLAFFDKSSLLILSNSFGGTYPMDEWSRWLL